MQTLEWIHHVQMLQRYDYDCDYDSDHECYLNYGYNYYNYFNVLTKALSIVFGMHAPCPHTTGTRITSDLTSAILECPFGAVFTGLAPSVIICTNWTLNLFGNELNQS